MLSGQQDWKLLWQQRQKPETVGSILLTHDNFLQHLPGARVPPNRNETSLTGTSDFFIRKNKQQTKKPNKTKMSIINSENPVALRVNELEHPSFSQDALPKGTS